MKKFSLALAVLLVFSVHSWANWNVVQVKTNGSCPNQKVNDQVCNVSVNATGAGHVIGVILAGAGAATHLEIGSVVGGGVYQHCLNCNATDIVPPVVCSIGTGCTVDASYTLNSVAGATNVQVTLQNKISNRQIAYWTVTVVELQSTGAIDFDSSGSMDNNQPGFTGSGVTLPITGSNDAVIQFGFFGGSTNSIDSSYQLVSNPAGVGVALLLNTNSGVAPTWTYISPLRTTSAVGALAFKEQ